MLGVGASHSTLMNTHWDEVVHLDRAERFREALALARDEIAEVCPDVVVIVGSNHFRGFWLDLIPAFTLGVGEVFASGEAGTPEGPQRVATRSAQHLLRCLVADQFDMAFSAKLQIDHGQTHAIQYLLNGLDVDLIPLVVNVFAPPLPSLQRCSQLGHALRRAIDSEEADHRVVVIGSGGLSHRLPFPDWRYPTTEDQRYLVEAWLNGRNQWKDYEVGRRRITRSFPPSISEDFDRDLLDRMETADLAELASISDDELEARAGNGGQEIRTWMVMAAALGFAPARTLAYEPMPEWLTGMGISLIDAAADYLGHGDTATGGERFA